MAPAWNLYQKHLANMDMSSSSSSSNSSSSMSSSETDHACKISMLWNWYTIDSCFIAKSWHIRSKGMFAGSCIGVLLLVVALEAVRRLQREYDRRIVREWQRRAAGATRDENSSNDSNPKRPWQRVMQLGGFGGSSAGGGFKPTLLQQLVRALFYTVQFGAAYIVMLLAMYYNGYFIICILLGAFIGHGLFGGDFGIRDQQENGTACC